VSSTPVSSTTSLTFGGAFARLGQWLRDQPAQAALLAACVGTLVWFYAFTPIWVNGSQSTLRWSWMAWNGEQLHGRLVGLISIFLVWYHRDRLLAARKEGSALGLVFLVLGVLLFLAGARSLQPRLALLALPFLFYGTALFVWGKEVARIVLFPCAFLVFMIPVAALEQATFWLQFVITHAIGVLSDLIGIKIAAVGTTLRATDGSFNFEIAEGCSGVRSLTAMSMLTAVYVHLTQDRLWKKGVIFAASLLFSIVGNIGRLFTIILVAKFINADLAGGIYHDYSGFIFFPVAVLAMTSFSRLLNLDWKKYFAPSKPAEKPVSPDSPDSPDSPKASPVSYDY